MALNFNDILATCLFPLFKIQFNLIAGEGSLKAKKIQKWVFFPLHFTLIHGTFKHTNIYFEGLRGYTNQKVMAHADVRIYSERSKKVSIRWPHKQQLAGESEPQIKVLRIFKRFIIETSPF